MILVGVSKKIRMMLTSSSFQAEWIERTVQLWWDLKEQFMQKWKWCHCLLALGSFKPACCWFFLIHRLKKETKQWLKGTIHVMHTNCVVFQVMWKDWYLHCYSLKIFSSVKALTFIWEEIVWFDGHWLQNAIDSCILLLSCQFEQIKKTLHKTRRLVI